MKIFKIIPLLSIMVCCLLLQSCNEEHDNYYTEAQIALQMPEGITVQQIQGTLTLQNLNTMLSSSTSEIDNNQFRLTLLRGAYKLDVEGMIRYTEAGGASQLRHFRAHSDYVALADVPTAQAELTITLLQE